jgi:hypothetical protein
MGTMGDLDPTETGEWIDALSAVKAHRGSERTNFILNRLVDQGRREGVYVPRSLTTAYKNTIAPEDEEKSSGDPRDRASPALDHPLERAGDHPARQQGELGARRPHRELPVGRDAVRHRLRPLLARGQRGPRRRPAVHPGP